MDTATEASVETQRSRLDRKTRGTRGKQARRRARKREEAVITAEDVAVDLAVRVMEVADAFREEMSEDCYAALCELSKSVNRVVCDRFARSPSTV